jgi:glutaredoxin
MITKDLKTKLKKELEEKKEQDRLERVKANSKLEKIDIYIDNNPQSNNLKKHLDDEGIKYNEFNITKDSEKEEVKQAMATVNLSMLPIAKIKNEYFVQNRDFTHLNQLMNAIVFIGDPKYKSPTFEYKTVEHIKSTQWNLIQRLDALEKKLTPILTLVENISKSIMEEEGE